MNLSEIQICSPGPVAFTTTTHLTFSLNSQDRSSPFILKKATGLEPAEIIKTFNDGPEFFRMRSKERVVSFQIKLNPNYSGDVTMGDLRDRLYRLVAFNTKANNWNTDTKIQLRFMNGSTYIASLFGYVTHIDADIFSNSSDLIFTIQCDDPFLKSTDLIDLTGNVQNTSSVKHRLWNGDTISVGCGFSCTDNNSTAPHGFRLVVECVSTPPNGFIIWDSRSPLFYIFAAAASPEPGDRIAISSEEDARYFFLTRYDFGVQVSVEFLYNNIYWGSIWPMISPGENFFEISKGYRILQVQHRYSYWGV